MHWKSQCKQNKITTAQSDVSTETKTNAITGGKVYFFLATSVSRIKKKTNAEERGLLYYSKKKTHSRGVE